MFQNLTASCQGQVRWTCALGRQAFTQILGMSIGPRSVVTEANTEIRNVGFMVIRAGRHQIILHLYKELERQA